MSGIHILITFTNLFIAPLFAGSFAVPAQEGDHLIIKGLDAQVQLIAAPASHTLKVNGIEGGSAEGAYFLVKKENIIELSMNEYDGKNAWMSALTKSGSQLKKIEIVGLPVQTEIHLRSGSVVAQKWSKDLSVSLSQGKVTSTKGSGGLTVVTQKGDVSIQEHTGKVRVDAYSGAMSLKNIHGEIEAQLFSGPLTLEKNEGFCSLNSRMGVVKVLQGEGTLLFDNGKGSLTVNGFAGRIDGQNQEGSVSVQMAMDSEVDIKSKAGRIQVQAPHSSGASVNLVSVEGDIFVPNELRVNKLSSEKNVRGRLRGDAQLGSINVRSQDGVIIVK